MGRNERCWCGSGRKWKRCHFEREQQSPLNFSQQIHAIHEEFGKGRCLHPAAGPLTCSGWPIRAHTIQKKGGLGAIAEDGHVISLRSGFERLRHNEGNLILAKMGVNKASTFFGFCGQHDSEMFRPIEVARITLTHDTAFLLSFRALAYENLQKEAALRIINILRELDRGKSFEEQCYAQDYVNMVAEGTRRGLADLARWKADYDRAFMARSYSQYQFYCVAFAELPPVVACGAFYPEFDFSGKPLQRVGRGSAAFEHVTFNLTAIQGRGIAAFGWIDGEAGPAAEFASSFAAIPPAHKANAAVRTAFEYLENTFLQPSWWNSLSRGAQHVILRHASSGLGPSAPERLTTALLDDGITYWNSEVIEAIR
jgi:hypothetical protein